MSRNTFYLKASELNVVNGSLKQLTTVRYAGNPVRIGKTDEYQVVLMSDDGSEMLRIQEIINHLREARESQSHPEIPKSFVRRIADWFRKEIVHVA